MATQLELGALRYSVHRFVLLAVFAALLFHFAGRWDWSRGWAFVVAAGMVEALTLTVLAWRAPATLNERGKLHAKTAWFDRLFALLWLVLSFATPIVARLEVRAGVLQLPWTVFWAGVAALLAAAVLGAWAMLENEHFEQFVRIQNDRSHRVVDSGPYRLVRHPGYLAAIVGALVTRRSCWAPRAPSFLLGWSRYYSSGAPSWRTAACAGTCRAMPPTRSARGGGWSPASGDTCPVAWFTRAAPFRVCAYDPEIRLQVFELARRPLWVESANSSNR